MSARTTFGWALSTPSLPPPARWRALQRKAATRGAWIDMTMDGVFHVSQEGVERYRGTLEGLERWVETERLSLFEDKAA
jgi:hypothetical protein